MLVPRLPARCPSHVRGVRLGDAMSECAVSLLGRMTACPRVAVVGVRQGSLLPAPAEEDADAILSRAGIGTRLFAAARRSSQPAPHVGPALSTPLPMQAQRAVQATGSSSPAQQPSAERPAESRRGKRVSAPAGLEGEGAAAAGPRPATKRRRQAAEGQQQQEPQPQPPADADLFAVLLGAAQAPGAAAAGLTPELVAKFSVVLDGQPQAQQTNVSRGQGAVVMYGRHV